LGIKTQAPSIVNAFSKTIKLRNRIVKEKKGKKDKKKSDYKNSAEENLCRFFVRYIPAHNTPRSFFVIFIGIFGKNFNLSYIQIQSTFFS
jgi:hypothetical protein